MRKTKRFLIKTGLIASALTVMTCSMTFASRISDFKIEEYSNEYKQWLQLSDEERQKTIAPPMYEIPISEEKKENPLLMAKAARASMTSRFSLKDLIPANVKIRNQQQTNSCWAFAALSSLETNLAMANYKSGLNTSKVYDFSERHMEYATSDEFANGVKNENGYNRKAGDGGIYAFAESYLTNGTGAIAESEMPFKNNEDTISISEIQNKKVLTHVDDTIEFANYRATSDASKKAEIMNQIKEHIQNYGSVFAYLHGNSSNVSGFNCYNNDTGAKYCPYGHKVDHAVSIIGWDDNYSVDNFAENLRPSSNGAWIVRNSWGEGEQYKLSDIKNKIFEENKQQCIETGWNSAEEIPNEAIESLGFTIENDIAYIKYGDNGIIYVSYEDYNISSAMFGIIKASDGVDYDHIYQYDEFYPNYNQNIPSSNNTIMLATVFDKETTGTEYLTQVSLYAPATYTCKVYVNPNGTSKTKKDLKEVALKAGSTETFGVGYHTLEFAKPIEVTGSAFTVVVEIESSGYAVKLSYEGTSDGNDYWSNVKTEKGKCFAAIGNNLENCEWEDLGRLSEGESSSKNLDTTIKAYTTNSLIDESLKNIEITKAPSKTSYFEGENFDKTGMVVTANYNSKKNPTVILNSSDYSITNGTNLKAGQTSVTITYDGKSVTQPITVEKNSIVSLQIKTAPIKTAYKEGQNFDKTGMVVVANYKDGTSKTITDYTIKNGNNLSADQTEVIIEYKNKEVKQAITVTPNPLMEIKVTKAPNKTKYVEGQNFDKTGMTVIGTYKDGSIQEILDYTIENGTNLKVSQKSVTISFKQKNVEQEITVEKKAITKIEISKKPTKMQYVKDVDELDLTGGTLKVSYNDNSSEEVPLTSEQITVTGFSNKILGTNTITITYLENMVKLDVEIVPEPVAENSDFSKMNTKIDSIKYYTFSNKDTKEYVTIDMTMSEIVKNTENDSCEYYYYLSKNQSESLIQEWIKITEKQAEDDKVKFTINTKDIKNYEELMNSKTLYLYVKEVAKKGGNQAVYTTKAISMESNVKIETYLDNKKIENNNSDKKDNTVAPGKIPQTGTRNVVIVVAILIGISGAIFYIKYNKISKYVK